MHVVMEFCIYTTAEVESLMTSSLSNALLSVLKKHNGQRDILEVVIEIIGVLADNGLFIAQNIVHNHNRLHSNFFVNILGFINVLVYSQRRT